MSDTLAPHPQPLTPIPLTSPPCQALASDIEALPESVALQNLRAFISSQSPTTTTTTPATTASPIPRDQIHPLICSILTTFHLHVQSRISSACGQGFYTIGPCGEENLAAIALALDNDRDSAALHYRHLGANLLRTWMSKVGGPENFDGLSSLPDVIKDRARGYTVSSLDPVSGGNHCALGGNALDFLVTSTLASQTPPAVGRALGNSLAHNLVSDKSKLPFSPKSVHFVTLGDGSANNGHFLSALNLAKYAKHRQFKCPVVFGISDNGMSISLKGYGYLDELLSTTNLRTFSCDGNDVSDVYLKTKEAVDYSRRQSKPSIVVYKNLKRRFGHAATDRQNAYLTAAEIKAAVNADNLEQALTTAVATGAVTWDSILTDFDSIHAMCETSFNEACMEPKVTTREMCLSRNSQPLVPVPRLLTTASDSTDPLKGSVLKGKKDVMRKQMTKVIAEQLLQSPEMVYIGEDVIHGGYYLVTDGLAKKFPNRVCDFPPDETTLIGAGIGYAQAGLVPVVEIPYAKYLDCGFDMFNEACVLNWLSAGQRGTGMVFRLQGFDRGTFGGNFHTHNMLSMPPGVDVVCYSNGEDYVRGFRNAIEQAKGGRITMLVDCTALLNLRHLNAPALDRGWERGYPKAGEMLNFDDVRRYGDPEKRGKVAIVSYGNGVVTALQARASMEEATGLKASDIDVIDCMLISDCPQGLIEQLGHYDQILFADICKEGANPLSGMLSTLNKKVENGGVNLRAKRWNFVAAAKTYNPLGSLCTFLNEEDIVKGVQELQE
jgi:TPP-dependent pyruvate/acetoin dehydrogenase alpha subunit/pyruvate/2-oxoglutarate/acetoin dehydrogenase E1 component